MLVMAVAVVVLWATVLYAMTTFVEASSAMPPPSWVAMWFGIGLLRLVGRASGRGAE